MMKREIINDERVVNSKRKIQSDLCMILIVILMVSIPFQQFVLKAPASQYIVEFICFIFSGYYICYKNIVAGNRIRTTTVAAKKNAIILSFYNGIVITFVVMLVVGNKDDEGRVLSALITFAIATLGSFLITVLLNYFNNKKIKQIEDKLDED